MTITKREGSLAGAPTFNATPPAPSLPVLVTGPCTVNSSPMRDEASLQLMGPFDSRGPGVTEPAGTTLLDDEQAPRSTVASTAAAASSAARSKARRQCAV